MALRPDTERRILGSLLAIGVAALVGGGIGIYFFGLQSIAIAAVLAFVVMAAVAVIAVSGL